jgi:hypothetical protein
MRARAHRAIPKRDQRETAPPSVNFQCSSDFTVKRWSQTCSLVLARPQPQKSSSPEPEQLKVKRKRNHDQNSSCSGIS